MAARAMALVSVLALMASGCVSKQTYNMALADRDAAERASATAKREAADAKAKVGALEADVKSKDAKALALEEQLNATRAKDAEIGKLKGDLQRVKDDAAKQIDQLKADVQKAKSEKDALGRSKEAEIANLKTELEKAKKAAAAAAEAAKKTTP